MRITLREPDDQIDLAAGESWGPVQSERPHLVTNPGEEVATFDAKSEIEFAVKTPGAYRLEAWLPLDGELRPWIYSNPIYVR